MLDPDCIFCKIVRGEVPSFKVFEDERTLAFMDINPANPGHVLVIPKFHAPDVFEIAEPWLGASVDAVQKVAKLARIDFAAMGNRVVLPQGKPVADQLLEARIGEAREKAVQLQLVPHCAIDPHRSSTPVQSPTPKLGRPLLKRG